jgi:hypothetical protein
MAGQLFPAITPPSDEQRWALLVAAAYLKQAGTEAATRLLPGSAGPVAQVELMAQMRDDPHQSAALYETLVEVFDGWPVPPA